jgi:hypothetical protein
MRRVTITRIRSAAGARAPMGPGGDVGANARVTSSVIRTDGMRLAAGVTGSRQPGVSSHCETVSSASLSASRRLRL